MSDIAERLRRTTEHMASQCSAPMGLWNNHSNAALEAADTLDAQATEIARLKEALTAISELDDTGMSWFQVAQKQMEIAGAALEAGNE